MPIEKVKEPKKIVTDRHILHILKGQGIDKDYVKFIDYTKEHPSTKSYYDLKSRKQVAICGGLPKVTPSGTKICGSKHNETTVGWNESPEGFITKENVFQANVSGGLISVESWDNKNIRWQPFVYLGGVLQPTPLVSVVLERDPYNPYYFNNVLEWDYGICKRHLRVIEGMLLGRWKPTVRDPGADVRIKYNQSGDFRLRLGQYAISDDEELIPREEWIEVFDAGEEIGDSTTAFSTASDGFNYAHAQATWDAAYTAANATGSDAVGDFARAQTVKLTATNWSCQRAYLYHDPSAAAGGTVTAVVLGLYGESLDEANPGHADVGIVEGLQSDPFDNADYGDHRTQETLLHDNYHDVSASWHLDDYNDITFNAGGRTVVQIAIDGSANVKLCVRLYGDVTDTDPTGANKVDFWANEKGEGFQPRLVITYTVAGPTEQSVGGGSITPTGVLGRNIFTTVGTGGITPTGVLTAARKFFQAVGSGSVTPVGILGRKVATAIGSGSITPSGVLGRVIKRVVGSGAITPTGILGRLIKKIVGEGAVTPVGVLTSVLSIFKTVGEGAITPVGVLGRKISLTIGSGSITPSGVLARLPKITIGSGAITPTGALSSVLTIFKTVGEGAVGLAGILSRLIKITMGSGSITPVGTLGRLIKMVVGDGAITPVATLGRKISISIGNGAVAITGVLTRLPKIIVGAGSITPVGSLNFGIVRRIVVNVITASYRGVTVITSSYRKIRSITTKDLFGGISNFIKGG